MKLMLGLAIAGALCAGAAAATTVTIGFNDAAADNAETTSYSEAGFNFTPSVAFFGGSEPAYNGVSNGTIFAGTNYGTVLTSVDQRPFQLDSLDSAPNDSGVAFNGGAYAGGRFFLQLFPNLANDKGEVDLTLTYSHDQFSTFTPPTGTFERVVFLDTDLGPPTGLFGGLNPTLIDNLVLTPDVGPYQAAAPEPATWAMMLIGFGLVGAARRRHWAAAQAVAGL